jgi:hypothetical protein
MLYGDFMHFPEKRRINLRHSDYYDVQTENGDLLDASNRAGLELTARKNKCRPMFLSFHEITDKNLKSKLLYNEVYAKCDGFQMMPSTM